MWIKLCGIRDLALVDVLAELRPNAVGLNFYADSPRVVARETAAAISRRLPPEIARVGVFVNHSLGEIEDCVGECGLSAVQLHGDEPPAFLAELVARLSRPTLGAAIFRAWRMGGEGLQDLGAYLAECNRLQARPVACLIDARVPGRYGGSGTTVPWGRLAEEYQSDWPPLILAGGLDSENVSAAIRTVRPFGVDTASGIESAPGVKDPARMRAFVTAVRRASAPFGLPETD